jgi:branched-chain amino acid aminotransferase
MNHFSTDGRLGVKTPSKSKIVAILSPTTLKNKNLQVKCSKDVFKNWPLGHGQYTISGNLGTLVPYLSDAKTNGFDDYLWLLDDYVQEMTVLNVFFVMVNRYGYLEMATPEDNGCILPNTIRNTIMELKDSVESQCKLKVVERNISIHEIVAAYYEGRLVEAIGCSGPSFIQPISRIAFREHNIQLNTNP